MPFYCWIKKRTRTKECFLLFPSVPFPCTPLHVQKTHEKHYSFQVAKESNYHLTPGKAYKTYTLNCFSFLCCQESKQATADLRLLLGQQLSSYMGLYSYSLWSLLVLTRLPWYLVIQLFLFTIHITTSLTLLVLRTESFASII